MVTPLFILCPLRSFSSVSCGIVGQHPDAYGFPELNLFVADTVKELLLFHERKGRPQGLHGLKRTLAQLHDGVQTEETVIAARRWLDQHRDWPTRKLSEYILEQISPKIGVDKSPLTVMNPRYMERAYAMFPKASFLHLTRHPVSARKSMQEYFERRTELHRKQEEPVSEQVADSLDSLVRSQISRIIDPFKLWLEIHSSIIDFTNKLPPGQSMRIKGEDLLSEPDFYLPQIAEWLGIRTDQAAIEAMKHPENSPFACLGPIGARFGNDIKFLREPKLREGKIKEPSLKDDPDLDQGQDYTPHIVRLAKQMGYQ